MTTQTSSNGEDAGDRTSPLIIEFVLDETGSMLLCKSQTIGGYNTYIDEQRQKDGLCLLTLTKFDTTAQKTPYVDLDLGMVPNLTSNTFVPEDGGGTNLRDTIVNRMDDLERRLKSWDIPPRVLMVVMTDGDDNASKTTVHATRKRVEKAIADGWTCVYLGANQDAERVGSKLGFLGGNIRSFATAKMEETMQELSKATTVFRAAATASSGQFFSKEA